MKQILKTSVFFSLFLIIYFPLLADDDIDYSLSDFNFQEFLIGIVIGSLLIISGIWLKSLSEKKFVKVLGYIFITLGAIITLVIIVPPLYAILTVIYQMAIAVAIIVGLLYFGYKYYISKKEEIDNNREDIEEN